MFRFDQFATHIFILRVADLNFEGGTIFHFMWQRPKVGCSGTPESYADGWQSIAKGPVYLRADVHVIVVYVGAEVNGPRGSS
eukprot:COSAG02_NODE_22783_length_740_cov_1.090484_2_plen_82_part_00